MDPYRGLKTKIEMQRETITQVRTELFKLYHRLANMGAEVERLRQENEQLREGIELALLTGGGGRSPRSGEGRESFRGQGQPGDD